MPDPLVNLLQLQLDQLVQMNELLVSEREAIAGRSPEKITQITNHKTALLKNIQLTDEQLGSQFTAADLATDAAQQLKININALLVQIKDQNAVNGKIIQNNQITIKMFKDILFDSKKDQSSMTYNQLGQKRSASKYKPIKA